MARRSFLFTWKPTETYPHAEIRRLLDEFEANGSLLERWRCASHRMVREGDRAYVYKQGKPPRGIFAAGTIVGPAEERRVARPNENRFVVPIEFEVFVDPAERFLVSNVDLLQVSAPTPWNTQRSGVPLARGIEDLLNRRLASAWPQSQKARDPARKTERLIEVYERDQTLVRELMELYDGCCQICGSKPFGGDLGRITEGHHIQCNRSHPPAVQAAAFAGIMGRVRLARAAAMREQAYAQGSTPRLRQVSMTLRPAA